MTIRCMIVDDERPAREELAYLLSGYDDVAIVGQCGSVSEAVDAIRENRPDCIFLDIQMPGRNGFDLVLEMKALDQPPLVVFVTAYDQYAVEAFEKNAIDYIMKPFSRARLEASLDRVKELVHLKTGGRLQEELQQFIGRTSRTPSIRKISVERRGRMRLLDPEEVVFFRYVDRKITVHTPRDTFTLCGVHTLDQLSENLDSGQFFRTHRNTIVNLNHIKEFSPWFNGKYNLMMADENQTEVVLTRERVKLFKDHLGI